MEAVEVQAEEVTPVAATVVAEAEAAVEVLLQEAAAEPADKNKGGHATTFILFFEQQRLDELFAIETLQIRHLLAQPDIPYRNLELV